MIPPTTVALQAAGVAVFELKLLGGATIQGPEGAIGGRVARRHPLALLALLARSPERTASRDRAIGLLWPDSSDSQARARLRQAIHALRVHLDPEVVVSDGDQLRLDRSLVSSDVEEFEGAIEGGEPAAAVELYAGPFLDGLHLNGGGSFDRWLEGERRTIERAYEKALEHLAEDAERSGAPKAAGRYWERLVRQSRFSEHAVLRAMKAWAAAGDRGRAVELGRMHACLMSDELGLEPSAEILDFEQLLLEQNGRRSTPNAASVARDSDAVDDPNVPAPHPAVPPLSLSASHTDALRSKRGAVRLGIVPTAAAVAVLSLLVLVVLGSVLARDPVSTIEAAPPPTKQWVVISAFENESGDPSLDYFERMVPDWIGRGVLELGSVEVVPLYRVLSGETNHEESVRESAASVTAGLFLTGSVRSHGDSVSFDAWIGDPKDGRVVRAIDPVRVPHGQPLDGMELLRERVIAGLATHLDPRLTHWAGAAAQPTNQEAYRLFSRGLDQYLGFPSNWDGAVASFLDAAAADPEFIMPLLWALHLTKNQLREGWLAKRDSLIAVLEDRRESMSAWEVAFFDAQLAIVGGETEKWYRQCEKLLRITPRWQLGKACLAQAAYWSNRPREAAAIGETLDLSAPWPDNPLGMRFVARALRDLGEHERELLFARRLLARYPTHMNLQADVVRALLALGRKDEALAFVDSVDAPREPSRSLALVGELAPMLESTGYPDEAVEVWERRAVMLESERLWEREGRKPPREHYRLGTTLLHWGRLAGDETKIREGHDILSSVVAMDSTRAGALVYWGESCLRLGHTAEFQEVMTRLEAVDAPPEGRARLFALAGDTESALELLRESQEGRPGGWVAYDYAYDELRSHPVFQALTRPRG